MFLCFMMTFSFFGGASNVLADNVVASIGNKNYETMPVFRRYKIKNGAKTPDQRVCIIFICLSVR